MNIVIPPNKSFIKQMLAEWSDNSKNDVSATLYAYLAESFNYILSDEALKTDIANSTETEPTANGTKFYHEALPEINNFFNYILLKTAFHNYRSKKMQMQLNCKPIENVQEYDEMFLKPLSEYSPTLFTNNLMYDIPAYSENINNNRLVVNRLNITMAKLSNLMVLYMGVLHELETLRLNRAQPDYMTSMVADTNDTQFELLESAFGFQPFLLSGLGSAQTIGVIFADGMCYDGKSTTLKKFCCEEYPISLQDTPLKRYYKHLQVHEGIVQKHEIDDKFTEACYKYTFNLLNNKTYAEIDGRKVWYVYVPEYCDLLRNGNTLQLLAKRGGFRNAHAFLHIAHFINFVTIALSELPRDVSVIFVVERSAVGTYAFANTDIISSVNEIQKNRLSAANLQDGQEIIHVQTNQASCVLPLMLTWNHLILYLTNQRLVPQPVMIYTQANLAFKQKWTSLMHNPGREYEKQLFGTEALFSAYYEKFWQSYSDVMTGMYLLDKTNCHMDLYSLKRANQDMYVFSPSYNMLKIRKEPIQCTVSDAVKHFLFEPNNCNVVHKIYRQPYVFSFWRHEPIKPLCQVFEMEHSFICLMKILCGLYVEEAKAEFTALKDADVNACNE